MCAELLTGRDRVTPARERTGRLLSTGRRIANDDEHAKVIFASLSIIKPIKNHGVGSAAVSPQERIGLESCGGSTPETIRARIPVSG